MQFTSSCTLLYHRFTQVNNARRMYIQFQMTAKKQQAQESIFRLSQESIFRLSQFKKSDHSSCHNATTKHTHVTPNKWTLGKDAVTRWWWPTDLALLTQFTQGIEHGLDVWHSSSNAVPVFWIYTPVCNTHRVLEDLTQCSLTCRANQSQNLNIWNRQQCNISVNSRGGFIQRACSE
jgi:hypothetical protein